MAVPREVGDPATQRVLNWVIVREKSEGEYAGVGSRVHQGQPIEAATDVSMMTLAGVERIMRFAFKPAQSRPSRLLTVITKSNAQRHAMAGSMEMAPTGNIDPERRYPSMFEPIHGSAFDIMGKGVANPVRRRRPGRPGRSA